MNFRKIFIFSVSAAVLLTSALFAAKAEDGDEEFIGIVTNVLSGNGAEVTASVSSDAYLVYGGKFEHLYGVITGSNKKMTLREDPARKITFYSAKINDSGTGAFVTLRTDDKTKKKGRFHTIVFMKNGSGIWKIVSWHTSV
ncbi:MAG: hypothetical protein ACM3Q2_19565 [Syntrophothermus sp.]